MGMEWKGTTGVILVFSHFFKLLFCSLPWLLTACLLVCDSKNLEIGIEILALSKAVPLIRDDGSTLQLVTSEQSKYSSPHPPPSNSNSGLTFAFKLTPLLVLFGDYTYVIYHMRSPPDLAGRWSPKHPSSTLFFLFVNLSFLSLICVLRLWKT